MIKRGRKLGFTIVELMVVIAVIVVLSTVMAVMYTAAQAQTRDTKVRDTASKIADAIKLFSANEGHYPAGGYGSTTGIAGTECTDGINGWFDTGYLCTVADTLIASKYLPSGFGEEVPSNVLYAQPNKQSLMVYKYSGTKVLVYYSLERPTSGDTAHFNSEMTKCGLNPAGTITQRDSYGMKDGICFDY